MMKRLMALLMALTLILSLFGCAAEPKEEDAVDEFIEQIMGEPAEFVAYGKDEADLSTEPLRILMDLEYVRAEPYQTSSVLNEFLSTLEQSGGLTDVVIEYVPKHGADRDAMLRSIQEEIAFGGGPDVFIMNCGGMDLLYKPDVQSMFPFPEKAMENEMFLPLDEYMEFHTRFTEWDKQTQAVLAAGRNDEGQQIIPLAYNLTLLIYSEADVPEFSVAEDAAWTDIVNDPVLSEIARPLYRCSSISFSEAKNAYAQYPVIWHADHIFGDIADYSTGELLVTEEEIFQRIEEICALSDAAKEASPTGIEKFPYTLSGLGRNLGTVNGGRLDKRGMGDGSSEAFGSEPLTMIPVYSDDGGVTASILSFAAINRNTKRPEEAYTVIDLLMREHVQRKYNLYSELLTQSGGGISLQEGIMLEETSVGGNSPWYMNEQRYTEVCEIRDRISTANFQTPLDVELYQILTESLLLYFDGGTEEEIKAVISGHYEKMQNMLYE